MNKWMLESREGKGRETEWKGEGEENEKGERRQKVGGGGWKSERGVPQLILFHGVSAGPMSCELPQ